MNAVPVLPSDNGVGMCVGADGDDYDHLNSDFYAVRAQLSHTLLAWLWHLPTNL